MKIFLATKVEIYVNNEVSTIVNTNSNITLKLSYGIILKISKKIKINARMLNNMNDPIKTIIDVLATSLTVFNHSLLVPISPILAILNPPIN